MTNKQDITDTTEAANEDMFYAALGRAITQWADVEQSLFQIYNHIMKPQIWVVTSATYHVTQTFNNKLALVNMAIKSAYSDNSYNDTHKKWSKLQNKLSKVCGKRNDIAHLIAFNHIEDGLYLRPAMLNAKAMINEDYKSKKYTTKDLQSLKIIFSKLSHEVDDFRDELPPPPLDRR